MPAMLRYARPTAVRSRQTEFVPTFTRNNVKSETRSARPMWQEPVHGYASTPRQATAQPSGGASVASIAPIHQRFSTSTRAFVRAIPQTHVPASSILLEIRNNETETRDHSGRYARHKGSHRKQRWYHTQNGRYGQRYQRYVWTRTMNRETSV